MLTMGSARHRSWSHTRNEFFKFCPRAFYYEYFPWGDEDEVLARVLRRSTSTGMLAGQIVHDQIALGLRQLARCGSLPPSLVEHGTRSYDAAVDWSRELATAARKGTRPHDDGVILRHHLYGAEDRRAESRGRNTVVRSLKAFENSEALAFLKTTDFEWWKPIITNTDDPPWFEANPELGFRESLKLRVYAVYDLALWHGGEFIIVDWKTGFPTQVTRRATNRQLAVYALWAMSSGTQRQEIRVQPWWLNTGSKWSPREITDDELKSARRMIEAQALREAELCKEVQTRAGIKFEVSRDDFHAEPSSSKCAICKFRPICSVGRLAMPRSETRFPGVQSVKSA